MESHFLHILAPDHAHRFSLVFLSFIFWSSLFLALYSRPTSTRLKTKATFMNIGVRTHRAELATRSVAALHSAIVAVGSSSLVFWRSDQSMYLKDLKNPRTWPEFNTYSDAAVFYACLSAGFFVADLLLCVVQIEEHGLQFVAHAVSSLCGCVYCLYTGEGLMYLMLLMLFEWSTPFLHLRWWLLEYNYKDSLVYALNGLCLVSTFSAFRIVIGVPVLLRMVYELQFDKESLRHSLAMRWTFTAAPLIMVVLNVSWGVSLWKGFLQTLGVIKKKKHA